MIETQFFILESELYQQIEQNAKEQGVSVDYFLMEFCEVQGPIITPN